MSRLQDGDNLEADRTERRERPRPRWVGYVGAVALVAVVNLFVVLADPYFPEAAFSRVPYVLAIGAAGYVFGVGPAIVALALGLASHLYIALPVEYAFRPVLVTSSEWAEFATFALGSGAAGIGLGMAQRSRRRIQGLLSDLAEGKAVLDSFFSQSPITLAILDADLRFVKVNPYASRLIGMPADQLEGRLMSEAMPEFAHRILPRLRQVLESGETETNSLVSGELPDEPGIIRHWLFSHFAIAVEGGRAIGLGMIAVDITDRVRAEEALRLSEARFRTIFDRAGIGMTVVDMRGKVLAANPAFARLIGYDLDELPGINVQQYAYPADVAHADELLGEMVEGKIESFQAEKRYVKKDGTVIWGRLTASIGRGLDPEPPFIIGMIEDVTDRVRAEEALREEQAHRIEFYRRTIMAATQGKLVITERENIEALDGETIASWEITGPDALHAARDEAEAACRALGLGKHQVAGYTMAVGEALTNAIKHAGGGKASLLRKDDDLLFVTTDQGPGIEALDLPAVTIERGYTTAGTLGMGFTVIVAFCDRVYLSTGPEGTTVGLAIEAPATQG